MFKSSKNFIKNPIKTHQNLNKNNTLKLPYANKIDLIYISSSNNVICIHHNT